MLSLTSVSATEVVIGDDRDVAGKFKLPCQRVHAVIVTVCRRPDSNRRWVTPALKATDLNHSATTLRQQWAITNHAGPCRNAGWVRTNPSCDPTHPELTLPLRINHMKSTCGFCVLFRFHMISSHVRVMLKDTSPHERHMWPYVSSSWSHVRHKICRTCKQDAHARFAGPHMCLTCEKYSSHVAKRVKLEQHMWATCESTWDTCGFNVIFP